MRFAQSASARGAMRARLERVYRAAVAGVEPGRAVRKAFGTSGEELSILGSPVSPQSQLTVLAVGKAGAAMAAAVEAEAGGRIREGLVVTRDPPDQPLLHCRHRQAGHPVPDARSDAAAKAAITLVSEMPSDDVLVVLLSGGASALLASPPEGVRPIELVELTRLLLASGADIEEVNTIRKQVSRVSGGRLANAANADRVEVLVISDVPGDRLEVIGSGPFAEDHTGYREACDILRRRDLWDSLPPGLQRYLEEGELVQDAEGKRLGGSVFQKVRHHVVASNEDALVAAVRCATEDALRVVSLGAALYGEARVAGERIAAEVRSLASQEGDLRPVCFIGGGETTVTLRGAGKGGRNQELALAAAIALEGIPGIGLLAAGTDGIDGVTDAAGAFVDGGTVARGEALGLVAQEALDRNDSYGFFEQEGGLFRTGPSGTNVMDLILLCVGPNEH
jgi:glycerate 2-kinase